MAQYDTAVLGFPIWWYYGSADHADLEGGRSRGKTVVPFATSREGSGLGHTVEDLRGSCAAAVRWQPARYQ